MAKKKYYGVKKGKKTGIFMSWEACKAAVDGFPGAEYKGFATREEVCDYLQISLQQQDGKEASIEQSAFANREVDKTRRERNQDMPAEGGLLAYVDGSYNDSIKKYAFGCVFILPDGRVYTEFGNGDNPTSLQHRNVTGEMLGAMYAVKVAMLNGFQNIEIRYDYQGIEKWVTGEWRSKTELTQKYAQAMRGWMQNIRITFTKVPAHSNVKYNELADQMAKTGLVQGNGVPAIKHLDEMEAWTDND